MEDEEYLSDCCGAEENDIGVCSTCLEHCEFTNGEDEE